MRYMFMRFPEGKAKAVTFSYDDGSKADLRLADILDKNGLKGTFNVMSGMQDQRSTTDAERLDLMERGHEIALHGDIHRAPCLSRPIDTIRDTLDCRLELEKRFGRIIRGYAYPDSGIGRFINGLDYSVIRNQLSVMGVAYARTLGGDNGDFLIPNDPYAWMPTAHHNNPALSGWIDSFLSLDIENAYAGAKFPRLLYIWGHSSEFDRDGNWAVIEDYAERIGRAKDVWAATNIEIIDYINAYRSLITSASGDRVYNPTLVTVHFVSDGVPYVIAPGKELIIN